MTGAGETWSCVQSDAIDFLRSLPDDSVDLLFSSPPYLEARTYGIGAGRKLDDWVSWMVELVTVASPKVKGLIAINCEGQTRNYRYLPSPFLLAADLHRAGFNLRKPVVFHRIGIPGSGGPDWLRNDWEPIICVTRPGKLPWSDNTACGHAPKWAPGGEMAHRMADGQRVNQWGMRVRKNGKLTSTEPTADRDIERPLKPSHRILDVGRAKKKMYSRNPNGTRDEGEHYAPPAIANPGNVIKGDVGGGRMGHNLAHTNEAPFPLKLAEFFVLSFCPPGGLVIDCFSGSGTTAHAAVLHGRRFAGCDLRQSQVDLCVRRLKTVTPGLFTGDTIDQ